MGWLVWNNLGFAYSALLHKGEARHVLIAKGRCPRKHENKRESKIIHRHLEAYAWNLNTAILYWPMQVTRITHIQGVESRVDLSVKWTANDIAKNMNIERSEIWGYLCNHPPYQSLLLWSSRFYQEDPIKSLGTEPVIVIVMLSLSCPYRSIPATVPTALVIGTHIKVVKTGTAT